MSHWLLLYMVPMILMDAYDAATESREEMGYEVEESGLRLKFEDKPGLEVTAKSLNVGDFLEVTKLAGTSESEAASNAGQLFERFADNLVEWNLTRKGELIPANLDGVHSLGIDLGLDIVLAWIGAMGGVDNPLKKDSPNGATSLESTMPMSPPT